jgi:hypothetical protein
VAGAAGRTVYWWRTGIHTSLPPSGWTATPRFSDGLPGDTTSWEEEYSTIYPTPAHSAITAIVDLGELATVTSAQATTLGGILYVAFEPDPPDPRHGFTRFSYWNGAGWTSISDHDMGSPPGGGTFTAALGGSVITRYVRVVVDVYDALTGFTVDNSDARLSDLRLVFTPLGSIGGQGLVWVHGLSSGAGMVADAAIVECGCEWNPAPEAACVSWTPAPDPASGWGANAEPVTTWKPNGCE